MATYISREVDGLMLVFPEKMCIAEAYGYARAMREKYNGNLYGVTVAIDGENVNLGIGLKGNPTERMKRLSPEIIEMIKNNCDFLKTEGCNEH